MNLSHIIESAKVAGDWFSVWVVLGTLAKVLPSLAALLSIIWYLVRFYDRGRPSARAASWTSIDDPRP